jgi:hypothetical protein
MRVGSSVVGCQFSEETPLPIRMAACAVGRRTTDNRQLLADRSTILFVLTLICMQVFTGLHAQSTGQLRFRFEPDRGMQYVLDGKYRLGDRELTLEEGRHTFTFWAPERLMMDTAFIVEPGLTKDVLVRLRYSQEYVDHRRALERYASQQRIGRIWLPVATIGAGAWTTVAWIQLAKAHSTLVDLEDSYTTLSDPDGIQALKTTDLPNAQADLRKARTHAYVASGVFAATTAATVMLRKKLASRSAPEFQDSERIRFEGLVWEPGEQRGTWAAALSIPIR